MKKSICAAKLKIVVKALLAVLFCALSMDFYVLRPLTRENIEEYTYNDDACYFIGSDGSRYYFWGGHKEGPHIIVNYAEVPEADKISGWHLSKFSSSGEWIYTSRLPFKGIICFPPEYWKIYESEGLIFLTFAVYEASDPKLYAFDSLGEIVWTTSAGKPAFCQPVGIFQNHDEVLYFGYQRAFKLFKFHKDERRDVTILEHNDIYNKFNKLSLPHERNRWNVCRIAKNRFLVIALNYLWETIGDSLCIITFTVDTEGNIKDTVQVYNAENNTAQVAVNTEVFRTSFDYFVMPDSSVFFVYGRWPKAYIIKFSKNGEFVPFAKKGKVFPIDSLPLGYQKRGHYFRLKKKMEYWDYAVDSLGNFYLEVRRYDFRFPDVEK
ncbi:hypothetical protein KAU34_08845 [candidate division WOR-3 bacterium]|nr:hypothetical protein [candidate division WOR-3 bacterium]